MHWIKKGVIFAPDRNYDWMVSHASVPVVDEAREGVLRIYFGTRDQEGRSQTSYIEVDADQPENVLYIHDQPILALGKPGSFDDRGIMPSWIVNYQNKKLLYYIGWNVSVSVPYHLSIGLAPRNPPPKRDRFLVPAWLAVSRADEVPRHFHRRLRFRR